MNPTEYETMHAVESVHWWYHGLRSMLGHALSKSPIGEMPVVLDAGCGTGANLHFMRERLPRGRFIALDISTRALRHVEPRENVTLLVGDANILPLPDASVDLVLACDLLGQAGVNAPLALFHFHRVLKPGGVLLVNVPAFTWLRGEHDEAVHVVKRFFPNELHKALQTVGFHGMQERFWNFLAIVPMLAHRVLTRSRSERSSPRSDLAITLNSFNPFLCRWQEFETALAWKLRFPFGSSLFVIARKPVLAPTSSASTNPFAPAFPLHDGPRA